MEASTVASATGLRRALKRKGRRPSLSNAGNILDQPWAKILPFYESKVVDLDELGSCANFQLSATISYGPKKQRFYRFLQFSVFSHFDFQNYLKSQISAQHNLEVTFE